MSQFEGCVLSVSKTLSAFQKDDKGFLTALNGFKAFEMVQEALTSVQTVLKALV